MVAKKYIHTNTPKSLANTHTDTHTHAHTNTSTDTLTHKYSIHMQLNTPVHTRTNSV